MSRNEFNIKIKSLDSFNIFLRDGAGSTNRYQDKSVDPTKSVQSVAADSGYDALRMVTVGAIPDSYQDVTSVTASAADVMSGKTIVDATGSVISGNIANIGSVAQTLDLGHQIYTIPAGYHDGNGQVRIYTDSVLVTPSTSKKTVSPQSGKVLGTVTVNPIPSQYIVPEGTSEITANGIYDIKSFASVSVNVQATGNAENGIIDGTIAGVYVNSNVTSIKPYAFIGCTQLTDVLFPNVQTINADAFAQCENLVAASFPECTTIASRSINDVGAFASCKHLSNVSFPKLQSVQYKAFTSCSALASISIPVATSIGSSAFMDTGLSEIYGPEVTTVGISAFYRCTNLKEANFPKCTSLMPGAFSGCYSLSSVNIPNITSVNNNVFWSCSSMTSFNFSKITFIGDNAFRGCRNLAGSVYASVCTSLYAGAFVDAWAITGVEFPNLPFFGLRASSGASGVFTDCSAISYASFPLASGVIGSNMFMRCRNLENVYIPNASGISVYAFSNCSKLTSLRFNALTNISAGVFTNCFKLVSLYLLGSTIAVLSNSNAFTSTPIAGYINVAGQIGSIYVKGSLYGGYRAATNWSFFADRFVAMTDEQISALTP